MLADLKCRSSRSSGLRCRLQGFTLAEMVVSVTILAILAGVAIPYAEVGYKRAKEAELRQSLRKLRNAIDDFHRDCEQGLIAQNQSGVSRDCFPNDLSALVEGVEAGTGDGMLRYYLRRIPSDPFAEGDSAAETHWDVRGYRDTPDGVWSGDDVFDVRVRNALQALDRSDYKDW